jgi:hypothetical protein
MKKRWGVRVVAILMLIAGLLLFLLGILPAVRVAIQGAGNGLGAWLAIPSALFGCAGALFLFVAGAVLLTVGKIAENFAPAPEPAPVQSAKVATPVTAAALGTAESSMIDRSSPPPVVAVAVAAPVAEAAAAPAAEAGVTITGSAVAAGAVAGAIVAEKQPAAEPVLPDEIVEDLQAPAPIEEPALEEIEAPAEPGFRVFEAAAAEELAAPEEASPSAGLEPSAAETVGPQPPTALSPQEEVSALQAQLAALQAQLDQLEGVSPGLEDLPAVVEDEGPAPGAAQEPKLPGAEDAARVAAEMAALNTEPQVEAP